MSVVGSGTMVVTKPSAFVAKTREQYSEITIRIFTATSSRLSNDLAFV